MEPEFEELDYDKQIELANKEISEGIFVIHEDVEQMIRKEEKKKIKNRDKQKIPLRDFLF